MLEEGGFRALPAPQSCCPRRKRPPWRTEPGCAQLPQPRPGPGPPTGPGPAEAGCGSWPGSPVARSDGLGSGREAVPGQRRERTEVSRTGGRPCPKVKTRPSLVRATENWVPHATFLMLSPHRTSTFWKDTAEGVNSAQTSHLPSTHLRGRLGRGVPQSQLPVVPVPKGPDHHPVSRHHQRVVQPARHLRGRGRIS